MGIVTAYPRGSEVYGIMQIPHFVRDDNRGEMSFIEERDVRIDGIRAKARSVR
jgi:hypothetical protein